MAIIYTYPLKPIPSLQDSIVITDSADSKKTKITSVQAIIDLLPFVFAENAWNTISFPGVAGTPADVQAFGVNQTLNLIVKEVAEVLPSGHQRKKVRKKVSGTFFLLTSLLGEKRFLTPFFSFRY